MHPPERDKIMNTYIDRIWVDEDKFNEEFLIRAIKYGCTHLEKTKIINIATTHTKGVVIIRIESVGVNNEN